MDNHNQIEITVEEPRWQKALPNCDSVVQTIVQIVLETVATYLTAYEISIVLANDNFVQKLNRQYRDQDKPTNVLSFPTMDSPTPNRPIILGDVILAYETIKRETEEQNKTLEEHFSHLLIHGVLHLLGYDHQTPAEAEAMEAIEVNILAEFNITNPYID